ncbi:hypothetical protein [Sandarakinorhabdus sp.]|uniref:hypothetical protein n=1 Tax=Sandarakinorhabdus sp. TaxID=1916663 RepID=UPI003341881E
MPTNDSDGPNKAQQMADDAVAAGKRALESDKGKQVADIVDAGFTKAGQVVGGLLDNPTGDQIKRGTNDLLAKAGPFGTSDIGRNVLIGGAVGFFVGLVFSFIGMFWGLIIGAALGFLRTITKKS